MTNFAYTSGNINNLDAGDSASMTDIKGSFQDIPTFLNGRTFNEDNLPVSLLQRLGLNDSSSQKGRGKTVIAQTESRSNAAFGTLTTPSDAIDNPATTHTTRRLMAATLVRIVAASLGWSRPWRRTRSAQSGIGPSAIRSSGDAVMALGFG